jgi:hypothetical protein
MVPGSSLRCRIGFSRLGTNPAPENKRGRHKTMLRPNAIASFDRLERIAAKYTKRAIRVAASAALDPLRIKKTNPRDPQTQKSARQRLSTSAAATAESRRSPH